MRKEKASSQSIQQYLHEMGQVPLLSPDEERALAQRLEADRAALKRLVLSSPVAMRQVVNWDELVRRRYMDVKELLPRGTPSRGQLSGMARRIRSLACAIRRAKRPETRPDLAERMQKLGLDPDKVRRLARRIRDQARRLREGRPTDPLAMSAADLLVLDTKVAALEDALRAGEDKLISANLRLVVSIAGEYSGGAMEISDLIQEGTLGLMRAVERFRAVKGFRFSTYATWWIRQAVSRAISEQARTVHVPVHVQEAMARFNRITRQHQQEHGEPARLSDLTRRLRMSGRKIGDMLKAMQEQVSLAAPVGGEDDEFTLADTLVDQGGAAPGNVEEKFRRTDVARWLSCLSEREAGMLKMRYGIDSGEPATLDDVGRAFGVTRERVRQIETAALKKLRQSPLSDQMRDYSP